MYIHSWIRFNRPRVNPGRLSACQRRELWTVASDFASLAEGWRCVPPALYPPVGRYWLSSATYVAAAVRWRLHREEVPRDLVLQGGVYVDPALERAATNDEFVAENAAQRIRQAAEEAAWRLRQAARYSAAWADLAEQVLEGDGIVAFPA